MGHNVTIVKRLRCSYGKSPISIDRGRLPYPLRLRSGTRTPAGGSLFASRRPTGRPARVGARADATQQSTSRSRSARRPPWNGGGLRYLGRIRGYGRSPLLINDLMMKDGYKSSWSSKMRFYRAPLEFPIIIFKEKSQSSISSRRAATVLTSLRPPRGPRRPRGPRCPRRAAGRRARTTRTG